MKKIVYGLLLLCGACKKQSFTPAVIQPNWHHLLNDSDRLSLDTLHPLQSHQQGKDYYIYQLKQGFVLIQKDSLGRFCKGRIVSLSRNDNQYAHFNGSVRVESLQRSFINSFTVSDGHRMRKSLTNESLAVPYDEMPEVIVVGYRNNTGAQSFVNYMCLQNLIDGNSTGSISGGNGGSGASSMTYSSIGPAESGGSSVGSSMNNTANGTPEDLVIHFETSYKNLPVDMDAWMNCFNMIPDAHPHGDGLQGS